MINTLKESFRTFEEQLNGHSKTLWHQLRKDAINHISEKGLPGLKDEEYKYTHLTKAVEKKFDFSSLPNTSKSKNISAYQIPFADEKEVTHLFVVNGNLIKESLDNLESISGLEALSLKDAATKYPEQLYKHLGKYADFTKDAFIALNTAFSLNGVYIRVSKKTSIEKPIVIHNICDAQTSKEVFMQRNLIMVEESAQVNIVENNLSSGTNEHFSNVVSEMVVAENAQLNYYKLQNHNNGAYHIDNTHISQFKYSNVKTFTITLDGTMIRNNLGISLEDEDCESHMFGLYVLNDKCHVDNHTTVDHKKPNCFSNEIYKGILDENSKGIFNGKIYVQQDAQKTNAFQSNKNILLTDTASINTKPQLEIWADDVKCSHGCTTGQLDEEQLFYLRSRGISKNSARAMLLHAFANDIIDKIEIGFLKEFIDKEMYNRLD